MPGRKKTETTLIASSATPKRALVDLAVAACFVPSPGVGEAHNPPAPNTHQPSGKVKTPDGGNGGDGGSVILRASSRCVWWYLFTLQHPHCSVKSLAGVPNFMRAPGGAHGTSQGRHGANGKDMVVEVPLGTVVYRLDGAKDDDGDAPSMQQLATDYEVVFSNCSLFMHATTL